MDTKKSKMTATIQIRVSTKDKEKLKKIFAKQGLTISAAVRMFLKECVRLGRLPFVYKTEVENKG